MNKLDHLEAGLLELIQKYESLKEQNRALQSEIEQIRQEKDSEKKTVISASGIDYLIKIAQSMSAKSHEREEVIANLDLWLEQLNTYINKLKDS